MSDDQTNDDSNDSGVESSVFFAKGVGLLARDLAQAVMAEVKCGFNDTTEKFYVYRHGVWRPDHGQIGEVIARLLGNRYRTAHAREVLSMIRHFGNVARITCDPLPPWINVRNGMVDWATGELVEHDAKYLSTAQLPIDYDQTATCPEFDAFLASVLPSDCIEFIWEVIGYTMYAGNPLHVALMFYGKGRNGKGTLLRVLKALLGEQNCSAVGLHDLTENRFRAATLYDKLANLAGDLDSRWVANTAVFKAITGGDHIQGEHKYGAVFDFTPWAVPVYSANEAFGSADSSEGWWARWVVVPFPTSFLGREDLDLERRLRAEDELRGIMRRGIEALPALMERGRFLEPDSVAEAKTTFIAASDGVRAWIDEQCVLDPEGWEERKDLYDSYRHYSFTEGASKRLSSHKFYSRIQEIGGISLTVRSGIRGFKGIRLTADSGADSADGADRSTPSSNSMAWKKVQVGV